LPANDWSQSGDLLWDAAAGQEPLDRLIEALSRQTRTLAWFNAVDIHSPRWSAFRLALSRAGMPFDVHERYQVGVTQISRDFEAFVAGLSGNFRRNARRRMRNLEARGGCAFRRVLNPSGAELEALLAAAFQIERQSWKGREGSSILQAPGMAEFFTRQSRQVAAQCRQFHGGLYLDFLDVAGRPIAFELGYIAKGRQFAHKISYLDEYASEAPGHALRWMQLQHLAEAGGVLVHDNFGKLSEAQEYWSTDTYTIGRLVIASRRWSSRAMFSLYRKALPLVRSWREKRRAKREGQAAAFAEHAAKTHVRAASESDAKTS
jgi:hypothetical protein